MPTPFSPITSTPVSTRPQRATVWMQGRLRELRDSSQAAALEVEKFRAENGLTSARGELMSDQQLSDLNSQLIVAQADTANASGPLQRSSSRSSTAARTTPSTMRRSRPTEPTAPFSTISRPATSVISKREQDVTARFGDDHPQAVALRREQADATRQIFQELQQLTESYRNEYEVAKSREASLRGNVGELTGRNSQSSQSMVQLRELEQKSEALATLYQTFLARYEEASQQRSFPIAQARVISEADNPVARVQPAQDAWCSACRWCWACSPAPVSAPCRSSASAISARPTTCGRSTSISSAICRSPAPAPPRARRLRRRKPGTRRNVPAANSVTPRILRVATNAPTSAFAETLRNVKLAGDVVLQRQTRARSSASCRCCRMRARRPWPRISPDCLPPTGRGRC